MSETQPSEKPEHLSQHGYFHELLENEQFIVDVIQNPITAVRAYGLHWNNEVNDKRLKLAKDMVIEYAKKIFAEMQVRNFRNCSPAD